MASLFTFDPDAPRVESPWLTPAGTPNPSSTPRPESRGERSSKSGTLPFGSLADYGVTRLEAEPQEGPTEYKLHLLLRPRRVYSSSSTGGKPSGSQEHESKPRKQSLAKEIKASLTPTHKARQNRLDHLTTQLLWRLQQSAPEHSSSTGDLVVPKLPESAAKLESPSRPGKLLPGLESSRGALYEIGVSDDGTFVGLTQDELDESLINLRAMAASLGCKLEVVRVVEVGDCEWQEVLDTTETSVMPPSRPVKPRPVGVTGEIPRYQAQLYVAEALVTPDLSSRQHTLALAAEIGSAHNTSLHLSESNIAPESRDQHGTQDTEQLRVTFSGPTTSGKSSLLGTLSTATLDNGRGKSRLSLLKHRHERATGITSSVTQELIGYKSDTVIDWASGNIASWTDIHASAEDGRLVFVSDSAGHPRYRRTTVRGLIGWAPHWTLLCIAADDGDNAPSSVGGTSSAQEILGTIGVGVDLAQAHLDLALKLEKPLAIVITKLDLASMKSLKQTLSKILTAIKATGRTPAIIAPDQSKVTQESELTAIRKEDNDKIQKVLDELCNGRRDDLTSIVPIVITSASDGRGIRLLHALLRGLPIPPSPTSHDFIGSALNPEQPACVFHIEDMFGLPVSYNPLSINEGGASLVVAGYLRFGRLVVGDKIVVGPFPAESDEDGLPPDKSDLRSSPTSLGDTLLQPSTTELARLQTRHAASAAVTKDEWHNAQVVSIRNLRLPKKALEAGQAGTIGIVLNIPSGTSTYETPRIRKGMVLAIPSKHMIETDHTLQAATGFTASFEDGDINSVTIGSLVVVYIASVRASARVLRLAPHIHNYDAFCNEVDDTDDVFGIEDAYEKEQDPEPPVFGSDGVTDVTFELLTNREWIELGSQVLVMPGGGLGLYAGSERGEKGVAGLEGFVGKVIEVVD